MNLSDKQFMSIFNKSLEGARILQQGQGLNLDDTQEHETTKFVFILNRKTPGVRAHFLSLHPHKGYILPHLQHVTWPKLKGWCEYKTAVYKNTLYIIGGKEKETGRCSAKMIRYSPKEDKWTMCASMKKARAYFTVDVMDRRIVITGGEMTSGELLDTIESYDPLIDMWTVEGKMPHAKKHHSTAVIKNKMYICGGQGRAAAYTSNLWELTREVRLAGEREIFQHTWSEVWDKVFGRKIQQNKLFTSDGILYSIGGLVQGPTEDGKRLTDEMDINEPNSDDENDNEKDVYKRRSEAYVPSYRKLFDDYEEPNKRKKLGLPTSITRTTRRLQSIDVSNSHYRQKNPYKAVSVEKRMPQARAGAAVLRVGHRIYLFGGYRVEDEASYVPMVEYYHLKRKRWYTAFNLSTHEGESFRDIEVQFLDIPKNNPNFKVVTSIYKFPMW